MCGYKPWKQDVGGPVRQDVGPECDKIQDVEPPECDKMQDMSPMNVTTCKT